MIESDAWDELASEFGSRVGGHVDTKRLEGACRRFKVVGDRSWTDASWACWLSNRANEVVEVQAFQLAGDDGRWVTCELHVGFITVFEPLWMVNYLRSLKDSEIPVKWKRSQIHAEILPLNPIDELANRVAGNIRRRRFAPEIADD